MDKEATRKLKNVMAEIPILTIPNFTQPFIVETDASNKGLGGVLMQQGRPLAFLSQTLSDRAKKNQFMRENSWLLCWQYRNGDTT